MSIESMEKREISVTAPARLHFGFRDLNGALGRRFGSVGLALEGFGTRLTASNAPTLTVSGPGAERAARYGERLGKAFGLPGGAHVTISRAIPEHAGLGSGTQLGLAVGAALTRLYGLEADGVTIARALGRGARSGIGIGVFEVGGVLLDGGNPVGENLDKGGDRPPPVISRLPFPDDWRILLILDPANCGLHGPGEVKAFGELPPYSDELSGRLCRLVVMKALPALAEQNFAAFSQAVTELQNAVGDHFAPVQGGRYVSPAVAETLETLASQGVAGYGQSSWGPTGFALFATRQEAEKALETLGAKSKGDAPLEFVLCRGRNQGCLIETRDLSPIS